MVQPRPATSCRCKSPFDACEGAGDGQRLLSNDSVRQITADAGTSGTNGIGWWTNEDGRYSILPKDAYWGSGAQHQVLLVVPSWKLIVVGNGGSLSEDGGRNLCDRFLFEPLADAIENEK